METLSKVAAGGGTLHRIKHASTSTKTEMTFAIFVPGCVTGPPPGGWPVVYWLSGLTCDDTNFCTKAGAFGAANKEGVVLVMPDTSPRGAGVAGEDSSWDIGTGAGFYVDATAEPWKANYNMKTYVATELPALVEAHFACSKTLKSISGHSMGGHGALTLAMQSPCSYVSVSAFAPVCHPTAAPWGTKVFGEYLGSAEAGSESDAVLLMRSKGPFDFELLIDVGGADDFMIGAVDQLSIAEFKSVCAEKKQALRLRLQPGYDHSYFFISTFIADHVSFHASALRARSVDEFEKTAAWQASIAASEAASLAASLVTMVSGGTKPRTCKAMVAFAPKAPLQCVNVVVAPPNFGEVRVKVIANALCHTDVYTWSGQDAEGKFPCILGHEAGAVVEAVGPGVSSLKIGDCVVPCYTPQCSAPSCIFCSSPKTNLCPQIRSSQGSGVMPDGTSRFSLEDGTAVWHFMGCSTFSEYTVLAEISCAKISPAMPLYKACLFGCGVSTGLGAVLNTTKVTFGSSVAVFGLGAVGLAVVQAAKQVGASRIIVVDVNPDKFEIARTLGATDCLNPMDSTTPIEQRIVQMTQWGCDYTFDCTGNVKVMRAALECAHRGWGTSCVIGVAASGQEISTRPFQLITGRKWVGTAFGGFKSRTEVPKLIEQHLAGQLPIDHFITHTLQGVEATNEAFHILEGGSCIRCVVIY
mmetsp:Transcript_19883/g.68539  ORF Transcript_19883/g.68539 Transcript_19883/m.68539 type:complete len:696 (+) Transcript_19883:67-2154(+)